MSEIDKISWRYVRQSLMLIVTMSLLALLAAQIWFLKEVFTPLMVSVVFALVIELADIMIWRKVAKHYPDSLPTFFMGVSGFRMLAAIGVMFVYFLVADREDIMLSFGIFMAYYFAILIHHSLYFTVRTKEKKDNKVQE